ncbi:methyl-accepting chemotaxis protein [Methanolobus sp. ZRKC5]|uniref:HAMP domain-containing methyl-accepting chemotaxis protein n=1 Tax=Methanolobus sp. ZRKC5 TaxID=3136295 RepID=UPI00313AA686
MFEDVKIKNLLIGSFAIILLLTAIVGYSGYDGMKNIDDRVVKADDMNRLVKYMKDANNAQAEYQLNKDASSVAEVEDSVDKLIAQAESSKEIFEDPVNDKQMDDVLSAVNSFDASFNNYVSLEANKEEAEQSMIQNGLMFSDSITEILVKQENDYKTALVQNADKSILEEEVENVKNANLLLQLVLDCRGERLRFMMHGEQKYADNVNELTNNIIEIATQMESSFHDQNDKTTARNVIVGANAYLTDFNQYASYVQQQQVAHEDILLSVASVESITEDARADQKEKMEQEMASSIQTMIIMVVLALIAGAIMAFFISNMISKPVNEMLDAANKVAAGDLTVELDNKSSNELGQLSGALKIMVGNLCGLISDVQMGSSKVASTSQEISASSEEMTAASSQVSATVTQISSGAHSQSSKAQEVSRAMSDMTQSVQEIATNAQNAAQNSTLASETIRDIGKGSEELLVQMDEIQDAVSESAGVIRDLDEKSKQIGEIVNLITSIADQTNLLALNAAIEAARAGEHGRGFAVVADEVRQLAENSSSAAKEIAVLIQDVQNGSHEAVDAMEIGTNKVLTGSETLRKTVDSVVSTVQSSEEIAKMAQDIAAAAEEQAASIEEITSSIEEVSAISEQSAAGTEQAAASVQEQTASMEELSSSAQELADLANVLLQGAAKFTINEDNSGTRNMTNNKKEELQLAKVEQQVLV